MPDLSRFTAAQERGEPGFDTALDELRHGRKRSHWIWYVFPQLAGLGSSPMAVRYGLQGVSEATSYLYDPVLRRRLLMAAEVVAGHLRGKRHGDVRDIMGSSIDAVKLVSSMTLFGELARRMAAADPQDDFARVAAAADVILAAAEAHGLPPCPVTRRALGL
jgi:uncharacterized protein (DUF1810 family)